MGGKKRNRYWELFKYEVGKYLRPYGALLSKVNRISEEQIVSEITSLSMVSPDKLSPEERLRLTGLQYKLDEMNVKQKGSRFVRSRVKWLEKG